MIQGTYKYRDGRYQKTLPVTMYYEGGRIWFKYPFSKIFTSEIKSMVGYKWHGFAGCESAAVAKKITGSEKVWSVDDCPRNQFQIDYLLLGKDPFARYNLPLVDFTPKRTLYQHQIDLVRHGLTRHYGLWASETGTGKSLAAIELMEASGVLSWWWIAPKSALRAIERELRTWDCKINPKLLTYEGLKKEMVNWDGGTAPQGIIFDEAQRVKTPTAQRSQAAMAAADGVRKDWGDNGYVILMSGSAAPRSPADFWNLTEIACPGFLKEGTLQKFTLRLSLCEQKESAAGGVFNQRVTWLDDENKCATCGNLPDAIEHDVAMGGHPWIKSVNEVAKLHRRMDGLTIVKFKKDCLELPEKIYREIECKAPPAMLRAAKLIKAQAKNSITALTMLRELSDGFQYQDEVVGKQTCEVCKGTRRPHHVDLKVNQDGTETEEQPDFCQYCDDQGQQDKIDRKIIELPTPKDDIFLDLLDEYSDLGRFVSYAGFTASIDKLVRLSVKAGWDWIRADGRGWHSSLPGDHLTNFQDKLDEFPRIVFLGQPSAAGTGLTLHAATAICYFSNDFNGESRIQSEDRLHRPGCKGSTIIDLCCLPTDKLILDNLKAKRKLQDMSLGRIFETLEADDERLF